MFEPPQYDYDRDRENTSMLIRDIRRVTGVAIVVVTAFALMLAFGGSASAGVNLMLIVGVPLLLIGAVGEILRRRSRRDD
jgi:hypothetical protein